MHRRFYLWRDKGIWEKLFKQLMGEPNFEWIVMIYATYMKTYMHASGAKGGGQVLARSKVIGAIMKENTFDRHFYDFLSCDFA